MIYLLIEPNYSSNVKEKTILKSDDIDEMCYFFYNFYKLYGGGYFTDCYDDDGRNCNNEFYIKYSKYHRMQDMKYSLLKDF